MVNCNRNKPNINKMGIKPESVITTENKCSVFKITYRMDGKSLKTLFHHKRFTIPGKLYKQLDFHIMDCKGTYNLRISENVKNQKDEEVLEILNSIDLKANIEITVSTAKNRYYVVRGAIDHLLLHAIKKLFISTIAYAKVGTQIPKIESIEFTFDCLNKQVLISSLELYQPYDNPYFIYSRNTLSIENIGIGNFKTKNDSERRNFYEQGKISVWKSVNKIDQEQELLGLPGIYMLFNSDNQYFYVGKSQNLLQRIKQHLDNQADPCYGSTHYRYSVIQSEYYEMLDLIENAAIHDIAWIMDMPKAKTYKPGLSTIANIEKCKMINKIERQTKR